MATFEQIAQGMILVSTRAPKIARAARPGQFVQRRGLITQGLVSDDLRAETLPFDPTPYPIHSVDADAGEITVLATTAVDDDDSAITSQPTGLEWAVRGPLGKAVEFDSAAEHVVFLADGGGIGALIAVMRDCVERGVRVTLLAGAENAWKLYPSHLLPHGVRELTATDDGSAGVRAPVTHLLPQVQEEADVLVASGTSKLYRNLTRMSDDGLLTIPTSVMLLPKLGCRDGSCRSCSIQTMNGPIQACINGPAFDMNEVAVTTFLGS